MLGPIGLPEMLIVLAIVILIFGAGKLPGLARALGESIRGFKEAVSPQTDEDLLPRDDK